MIVAVDAQLGVGSATGVGEYVHGLCEALVAAGVEVRALRDPRLDPWRFDRRVTWDQLALPRYARRSGAQLLHCASGTVPLLATLPFVVTVHDVAWLRVQQHARPYARWYFGRFSLERYRHARAIAVDSGFSRDELLALSGIDPQRVHVVYPGVAADIAQTVRSGDGRTLFVPGTVERRKNLGVVIRALRALPDLRLVSAGPFTPYRQECLAIARREGVADRVELRGYVPRAQLLDLYARSAVVAVPSRYEGFGYAAAQALCAGVPLVVSNRSSLPEVVGGDARIVGAEDPDVWAQALRETLADAGAEASAQRARERAVARFAWSASARATIAMYERALAS